MESKSKSKINFKSIFNIKIGKYIRLNIATIILLVSSIILNYFELFLIAYASALLHEIGHIIIAKRSDFSTKYISIQPFGIMAKLSDSYIKEPVKEIAISFAGPFVSLILFIMFATLNNYFPNENLDYASKVNVGLFMINIIPCLPLDGGRILKSMITEKYGIITAYNFMTKSSKIIVFILSLLCGALVLTQNFNFSFILILAFLMGNIAVEYKSVSIIAIKEIVYNKQKLYENKLNKVKSAAAYKKVPARVVLRNLSYNYYYVINILDENQRIINTVTETQVIDGIMNHGIGVKLEEIPKYK